MKTRLAGTGIMAAAIVTAACAGTSEYPTPNPDDSTIIVIDNTSSVASSLTVHLVPRHGTRVRLGTVRLNERKTFRVPRSATGTFRLVGQPLDGRDLSSQTFAISKGDRIEWRLDRNRIRFQGNALRR